MLADGKLEEARAACAEQQEEAHAQLDASADFRAEYFTLWEQQRKSPVVLPSGGLGLVVADGIGWLLGAAGLRLGCREGRWCS